MEKARPVLTVPKLALRTGLLWLATGLNPIQGRIRTEVKDTLTCEASLDNKASLTESREEIFAKYPYLEKFIEFQSARLTEEITEGFKNGLSDTAIAYYSSYDHLFRTVIPKRYEGANWDQLPHSIRSYLKFMRHFAAQEIHRLGRCYHRDRAQLTTAVMESQITHDNPTAALVGAKKLAPLTDNDTFSRAEYEMRNGKSGWILSNKLNTETSRHKINSFGIVVGSNLLYLDPEEYDSLTPVNIGFVDEYAFAQPGEDEWCHNNLIVMKVGEKSGGGGASESSGKGNGAPQILNKIRDEEGKLPVPGYSAYGERLRKPFQMNNEGDLVFISFGTFSNHSIPLGGAPSAETIDELNQSYETAYRRQSRAAAAKTRKAKPKPSSSKPKPAKTTSRSGSVCVLDDLTWTNDPFDRLREDSGRMKLFSVKGVLGSNSHAFCEWLSNPGNFSFTSSLAAEMPDGPLYLAWENPQHCETLQKPGHCVVLSDSPTAVANSMVKSLEKNPPKRGITIRMWDKTSKQIIERRYIPGR